MFKKTKSLDQILQGFIQVRDELAQKLVDLKAEKTDKEQQIIVLKTQIDDLDSESIRAARALQNVEELVGG